MARKSLAEQREAKNKRAKKYYEANKEEISAQRIARYAANREVVLAQQKGYYEAKKEELSAHRKEYNAANREAIAAQKKEYYKAKKEEIIARQKKYYEAKKEEILVQKKEYREANREEILAQKKEYYKREEVKAARAAWSAIRRDKAKCTLGEEEKKAVKRIYAKRDRMNKKAGYIAYHVDHIIPVAKGGKTHPDNLQILTAEENLKKGAKII